MSLAGHVALVTGAARNIGRAIALELAAHGATVVVNARSSLQEIEAVAAGIAAAGGQALPVLADVTERAAVDAMIAATLQHFGRLDILVNNAAVRGEGSIDQMPAEEWRRIMTVILDGAFNCVQAALPVLRKSAHGRIINIGGMTGHTGTAQRVHVVTAKAGLSGFTRALAHELGADGISVNCVVPGLIETARGASSGATPHHRRVHKSLLAGPGQPDDVAAMVVHLCGPGGRFITGQTIHVNGGAFLA